MKATHAVILGAWCLTALLVPTVVRAASSKIIHVSLHASASVQPDSNGFFSLASIADLTGGDSAGRARLASITVGRAPLPDSTRNLNLSDIALKLRQAGMDPSKDTVLEGAKTAVISLSGSVTPKADIKPMGQSTGKVDKTTAADDAPQTKEMLVHRGEEVTIIVEDDNVSITAHGVARQDGALGDAIQVHRDGVMTDMTVTVVDTRTVQLEI